MALAMLLACGGAKPPAAPTAPPIDPCPAFLTGSARPYLHVPDASAAALGLRDVVWVDGTHVLATALSTLEDDPPMKPALTRTLHTTSQRLGASVAVDDAAAFVVEGGGDRWRIVRVPLAGGAASTVATLPADARYEVVAADDAFVYVARPERPRGLARAPKGGGAMEALSAVPGVADRLVLPTARGLVFTIFTAVPAAGGAISLHRLDRSTGRIVELGRIATAAERPTAPPVVAMAEAGAELFVALREGEVWAVPSDGGAPRRLSAVDGGLRSLLVTRDHTVLVREQGYGLQLERGAAGEASRRTPIRIAGTSLRGYGRCVCGTSVQAEPPPSSDRYGEVQCVAYPAR